MGHIPKTLYPTFPKIQLSGAFLLCMHTVCVQHRVLCNCSCNMLQEKVLNLEHSACFYPDIFLRSNANSVQLLLQVVCVSMNQCRSANIRCWIPLKFAH